MMLGSTCSPCCDNCVANARLHIYNVIVPLLGSSQVNAGTIANHISLAGANIDLSTPTHRGLYDGGAAYWENNGESAYLDARTNNLASGPSYVGCTFVWQRGGRIIFTDSEPFYQLANSNTFFYGGYPEFSVVFSWLLLTQWSGGGSLTGPWQMQMKVSDRSGNQDGFSAYPTFNDTPLGMWDYYGLTESMPYPQPPQTVGWGANFSATSDPRCYAGATINVPFERHSGISITLDDVLFPRNCGTCQNGAMCHRSKTWGSLPTNWVQGCFEGDPGLVTQGLNNSSYAGAGTTCETADPCNPCLCPQDGTTFPYPVSAVGSFSNITRIGGTLELDPAIKADIESTTFPMEFYDLGFIDRLYVRRCLPSDPCGTICNSLSVAFGNDVLYAATGCAPSVSAPIGGVRFVKKCAWEFVISQQSSFANSTNVQVPYWCNNSRNVIQSSSGSFFATLIPSGNVFDGTVTISGSLSIVFQQNPLP